MVNEEEEREGERKPDESGDLLSPVAMLIIIITIQFCRQGRLLICLLMHSSVKNLYFLSVYMHTFGYSSA